MQDLAGTNRGESAYLRPHQPRRTLARDARLHDGDFEMGNVGLGREPGGLRAEIAARSLGRTGLFNQL